MHLIKVAPSRLGLSPQVPDLKAWDLLDKKLVEGRNELARIVSVHFNLLLEDELDR